MARCVVRRRASSLVSPPPHFFHLPHLLSSLVPQFEDCNGACWPKDYRDAWKGDGSCDDGQYGIDLNCPRHGCDGGDCGNCGDDNAFGPRCMVGFDQLWDQYWLFGDVFLRTVYTAYDWEKKRVGFAAQV